MADIKLVIKINENTYHRFINGFANEDDAVLIEKLFKNGTPLPELSEQDYECFDFENIDDAINDLNYQAERIKNPTYSFLKKSYEMGAKALNIMKIMNTKSED